MIVWHVVSINVLELRDHQEIIDPMVRATELNLQRVKTKAPKVLTW